MTNLEKELLAKYGKTEKSYVIKPVAKGRDAIKSLLTGGDFEEISSLTTGHDQFSDKYIGIKELAKGKGVSIAVVRKIARQEGCYTKGSGTVPTWLADRIQKKKSGGRPAVILDESKVEILRMIYGDGFENRRNKPQKKTLNYWAEQWGISRTSLGRKAKELGLLPDDYKKAWSPEELNALHRYAPVLGFADLRVKLAAMGFERSEPSLRTKLYDERLAGNKSKTEEAA